MRKRVAMGWALVACAALALAEPRAMAGPSHEASAGVQLDVPYFQQQKNNSCGAAVLAMVLHYWEKQMHKPISPSADQESIERQLDPRDIGIENTDMAAYLRDSGFRVFTFTGQWQDLSKNLLKGRPLIVGVGPWGDKGPLHYLLVVGVDWENDFVFVNDPAQRKLFRLTRQRFMTEWNVTGDWTLLAVPKEPM
ncbi:MAG: C39 family peptidase [Acidobacteriota bacterium]|nr:C39 family peptidase [Acidobacteriota bacterium]